MPLTKAQMKKIVMSFPGANEGTSYGSPAFKIEKKFFTRQSVLGLRLRWG